MIVVPRKSLGGDALGRLMPTGLTEGNSPGHRGTAWHQEDTEMAACKSWKVMTADDMTPPLQWNEHHSNVIYNFVRRSACAYWN